MNELLGVIGCLVLALVLVVGGYALFTALVSWVNQAWRGLPQRPGELDHPSGPPDQSSDSSGGVTLLDFPGEPNPGAVVPPPSLHVLT